MEGSFAMEFLLSAQQVISSFETCSDEKLDSIGLQATVDLGARLRGIALCRRQR